MKGTLSSFKLKTFHFYSLCEAIAAKQVAKNFALPEKQRMWIGDFGAKNRSRTLVSFFTDARYNSEIKPRQG